MAANWNDNQPIYRQLRDKVVALILDDVLAEGDALPSVRNVAAEYQLNPITVSKGYQELVDEGLVEKRRGLGMFVLQGAKKRLLEAERDQFMRKELPAFIERVDRLGIDPRKLLKKIEQVREGEDK